MPTTTTRPITLKTVISELQFIQQLAADSPKDERLKGLLDDAKADLADAAKHIAGTDPIIGP